MKDRMSCFLPFPFKQVFWGKKKKKKERRKKEGIQLKGKEETLNVTQIEKTDREGFKGSIDGLEYKFFPTLKQRMV